MEHDVLTYNVTIDGVDHGEFDNVQEITELWIVALMKESKTIHIERVEKDEN